MLDTIYGPNAAVLRQQIVKELDGDVAKSDKRCQYGHVRARLLELLGVKGSCKADEDAKFEQAASEDEGKTVETDQPTLFIYQKGKLLGNVPLTDDNRKWFNFDFELEIINVDAFGNEHYEFIKILRHIKP